MTRSLMPSHKNPSLYQILFSPYTPYVPPHSSPIAMFAWKKRIWVESTFGLVTMEPWEKYIVVVFFFVLLVCTIYASLVAYRVLSTPGFMPAIAFPYDTTLRNTASPVC